MIRVKKEPGTKALVQNLDFLSENMFSYPTWENQLLEGKSYILPEITLLGFLYPQGMMPLRLNLVTFSIQYIQTLIMRVNEDAG